MKCKKCGNRKMTFLRYGPLREDPKHPEKRAYDERDMFYECPKCSYQQKTVCCPNLTAGAFSI